MPKLTHRAIATGAVLTVTAVTASLLSGPAVAAPDRSPSTTIVTTNPERAAAGWLAGQFVDASHLPAIRGDHFNVKYGNRFYPLYGLNADVIFALAAAHSSAAKIGPAMRFVVSNLKAYTAIDTATPYDGAIGKVALMAIVAQGHPRNLGGYDLIGKLLSDECTAKSAACAARGAALNISSSVSESFVLLAEARAEKQPSLQAINYFMSLQCANGGFTAGVTKCGNGTASVDATAYAIMALDAVGERPMAKQRAANWLHNQQKSGGYWVSQKIPNVNSTGLAAAALDGKTPGVGAARDWLLTQQVKAGKRGAGAFRYGGQIVASTKTTTSPSILATAQALTGLEPQGNLALVSSARSSENTLVFAPRANPFHLRVHRDSRQTLKGFGFTPAEQVRVYFEPGNIGLGISSVGPLGGVKIVYRVPDDVCIGRHQILLTGRSSGLDARHDVVVVKRGKH